MSYLALIALVQSVEPASQAPLLSVEFQLFCTQEQSRGFNWRSGEWTASEFLPEQIVITKSPANDCLDPRPQQDDIFSETFIARTVCLNERRVGGRYFSTSSDWCWEYYLYRDNEWETSVTCNGSNIYGTFDPRGRFQMAVVHSDVSDRGRARDGLKDSLSVSVGRCNLGRG